jgi:hypothetical protein
VTNFDPAGFLVLLTVISSVAAGSVSMGGAHLAARLGVETYERSVLAIVGALIAVWVVAAVVVSTAMLQILAVTLAMVGAYAATRNVTASSYGWVLGVVLLFVAFTIASVTGVYQGVDPNGVPEGLVACNLQAFYYGGVFVFDAIGGAAVQRIRVLVR